MGDLDAIDLDPMRARADARKKSAPDVRDEIPVSYLSIEPPSLAEVFLALARRVLDVAPAPDPSTDGKRDTSMARTPPDRAWLNPRGAGLLVRTRGDWVDADRHVFDLELEDGTLVATEIVDSCWFGPVRVDVWAGTQRDPRALARIVREAIECGIRCATREPIPTAP